LTVKYALDYNLEITATLKGGDWVKASFLSPVIFESANEAINYRGSNLNPEITYDSYGNRWVTYKFDKIKDPVIQIHREYIITTKFTADKKDTNYLESKYVIINEQISSLANELYDPDNLQFFISVTDWINKNIGYDYTKLNESYYSVNTSEQTLLSKKGVCVDFSILEAAILNSRGIKTRFIVGLVFDGKTWASHAWIEAYDSNLGWVGLDPAYNQVYNLDLTHAKIGVFSDYDEMNDSLEANFSLNNVSLKKGSGLDLYVKLIFEKPLVKEYSITYPEKLISNSEFEFCIDSKNLVLPIQFFNSLEPKEFSGILYKKKCVTINIGDYNGFVYAPYIIYLPGEKIEASFEINKPNVVVSNDNNLVVTEKIENKVSETAETKEIKETGMYYAFFYLSLAILFCITLIFLAKRYLFKPSP